MTETKRQAADRELYERITAVTDEWDRIYASIRAAKANPTEEVEG